MAVNENLLSAVAKLSGQRDENGVWLGDRQVTSLIVNICRYNLPVFLGLEEDSCVSKIRRVIKQRTRIEIPNGYCRDFWNSDNGKKVLEKFNSNLPEKRSNSG